LLFLSAQVFVSDDYIVDVIVLKFAMASVPRKSQARPYHHGNLREAMIAAAIEIVREEGAEAVSVREAARRAGVSSGAPFRHFSSKRDLMAAVAEDGIGKLRHSIERHLERHADANPLRRLFAIAEGYVDWAARHPTHYRVLGDRVLIDFYDNTAIMRDNGWIRESMAAEFQAADKAKLLRVAPLDVIMLQSRALAYGLARMMVDDHLREFGIAKTGAKAAMLRALRAFVASLARDPRVLDD
jgi:AcrR family transcriptional regulator